MSGSGAAQAAPAREQDGRPTVTVGVTAVRRTPLPAGQWGPAGNGVRRTAVTPTVTVGRPSCSRAGAACAAPLPLIQDSAGRQVPDAPAKRRLPTGTVGTAKTPKAARTVK